LPVLDSGSVASTAAGGVFVGVDWGNSHHQVCVLDPVGRVVAQGKVTHDVDGLRELAVLLGRHGPVTGIAIERSEGLLVESLQQQGYRLFCVSPKMSARARERYRLAPSKSDAFDAFVLADSLRHEHRHWRCLAVASPLLAELRALTRDRERLVWNQRDVENQLRAIVQVYHPGVLHLFSSLDRDIALAFLRDYPTPAQAARIGPARMAAFCARHGYSGRTRPELLVARLRANLLSASPGTTAGKAFSAGLFVDQLELLNTQVRAITKLIRDRLADHPDAAIFLSFPGMGQVTAATMLAEMGEDRAGFRPPRFCSPRPAPPRLHARPDAAGPCGSATPRTSGCVTPSTGGPSCPSARTTGPTPPTRRPEPADSCTTGPCAASAPAGSGSYGGAGATAPPTTPTST
jgi:transposase